MLAGTIVVQCRRLCMAGGKPPGRLLAQRPMRAVFETSRVSPGFGEHRRRGLDMLPLACVRPACQRDLRIRQLELVRNAAFDKRKRLQRLHGRAGKDAALDVAEREHHRAFGIDHGGGGVMLRLDLGPARHLDQNRVVHRDAPVVCGALAPSQVKPQLFGPGVWWCILLTGMEGCAMGQVLHGSARTTAAVRRAIQHSQESLRSLAKRHGVNPKTVSKWKKRGSAADLPTGPKAPRSTVLTLEEEAVIVAFRRHTLLPLDDGLYALQATIPHLTRSSLHRCLQRHGMSRLPETEGEKPAKKRFKPYPIGYFHIDVVYRPGFSGHKMLLRG